MKNRLNAEIKRKYRQRMRIYEMYILCKAYEMYHMMQLHAACAKETLSYEEAETFSDMMNSVFSAKTSAETFIVDANDEANESIAFYEKFQYVLDGLEPGKKAAIQSFCKAVYHTSNCIGLKIDGFMFYPLYLESLIQYINGMCSFDDVRNSIIDFKPWYERPRKTDSKKFRRDFIIIERFYNDIANKINCRVRKKSLFGKVF